MKIVGFLLRARDTIHKGEHVAEEPNQEAKRPKRRLRPSSETVRERTAKQEQQAKITKSPGFFRLFFSGFTWPLRKAGRLIGKLGKYRVFRWISYIFVPPYIRNSWKELRLVSWPNMRMTLRLTYAVIVFSVVFGLIVAGVDWVLDKIFKELIIK